MGEFLRESFWKLVAGAVAFIAFAAMIWLSVGLT